MDGRTDPTFTTYINLLTSSYPLSQCKCQCKCSAAASTSAGKRRADARVGCRRQADRQWKETALLLLSIGMYLTARWRVVVMVNVLDFSV